MVSVALACARSAGVSSAPPPVSALALTHVTVIDVTDGTLHPDQTVVIVGSRVRAVGPGSRVRIPRGAPVVAAQGKYLIPGLWDMHVHSYCHWALSHPLFIANGVTGVREANTGFLDSLLVLRREIAAGRRIGPRQVVAGPSFRDEPSPPDECSGADLRRHPEVWAATPADARRLVDSIHALGADFIKTRLTGANDPHRDLAAEREIYLAIAAEARRVGLPLEGHMPYGELSPPEAAAQGQRIIDHEIGFGYCYPPNPRAPTPDSVNLERCRWLATGLRRHGAWLVPTLAVGANTACRHPQYAPAASHPSCSPQSADSLPDRIPGNGFALAQQAGLPILAGTDAINPAAMGFALHDELAIYVREGLTPLAALQTATLNPAKLYHATDSLGAVAAGKLADLVLLDANPLEDIRNTTKIQAVIANGRYFGRTALDSLLAGAARTAAR